jgi:uncharacterized protein
MTKIDIGTADTLREKLRLDLPGLVDTRALIQANSGGGKSWWLRLLVERAARHVPVIILDPEGEFATLREKVDLALVGQGGEMATDVRSAGLLARKLVELRVPAIVDLYDLRLDQRRAYVRLFLEALMAVPRAHWHPLLVIIDEAHLFAPERAAGEAESTQAVIALMSQGRKRGFAGIISTQRLSKLHKDVAAECNNVVIGRTWLDTDQARAGDLLGMSKADRQVLRDLEPGEFFAFGPAFVSNGIVRFRSDPVATTHPKAGERHKLGVPQASAAIQDVVSQIGDLPAQAEQEAKDLAALQRKVRELELQLRARPAPAQPVETRVEIPVFKNGEVGRLESAVGQLAQIGTQLVDAGESFRAAAGEISGALRAVINRPAPPLPRPQLAVRGAPDAVTAPRPATARPVQPVATDPDRKLAKAERAILTVLAQRGTRTKRQLAVQTGYAVKGGGFNNAISALATAGYITRRGDEVDIAEAGVQALGTWEPLPTGADLAAYWLSQLPKAERSILETLVRAHPGMMTKEAVAEWTGYEASGGGFNNAISRLRTLELITGGKDDLRASDDLVGA